MFVACGLNQSYLSSKYGNLQVSNAQCVLSALSSVGAGVAALSSSLPVYS